MKPRRTWHGVILPVALILATASAVAFAANLKPDESAHSNPGVIQVQFGPAISLMTPADESWLGLVVKDTDEALAKELKLPQVTGAIVVSVFPGSPAAKAGFQKNDVIMEFDGQRVRSAAQLQRLVKETPADRTVKVEISRAGKLQTLAAKIQNRGPNALLEKPAQPEGPWVWQWPFYEPSTPPNEQPFPETPRVNPLPPNIPKFYLGPLPNPKSEPLGPQEPFTEPGPQGKNRPFGNQQPAQENTLGISGQDLTPQLARYFGVKESRGVLVTEVKKGSPAIAAGLKAGDVIVRVGSQEVSSMAELKWLLQSQPNVRRRVPLGVVRNHAERQMSVLINPERPVPDRHGFKPLPIMSMRTK
jgi:serine protease Do